MIINISCVQVFIDSIFQLYSVENRDIFTNYLKDYYLLIEKDISPLLKSDLQFFYNETTIGTMTLNDELLDTSSIQSYISSLIKLESMTKKELIKHLLPQFIDDNNSSIDGYIKDLNTIHLTIGDCKNAMSGYKELLSHPQATIHRLQSTLQMYYNDYYSQIESTVMAELSKYKEIISSKFKDSNPLEKEFSRIKITGMDIKKLKVTNNISCFPRSLLDITITKNHDHIINTFHYSYFDKYDVNEMLNKSSEFIKIISDDTRMKIIQLLAKKKYYSSELALKLNINRGTVSYHMDKLKKIDILNYTFDKRKVFFSLNIRTFEKMFKHYIDGLNNLKP